MIRRVGALAAVGMVLLAGWSQAAADEPGFEVSSDGVTWAVALSSPLFGDDLRWVPGDERTSSFFVRNDSPHDASVRIQARDTGTQRLTAAGDVVLYARAGSGNWQRLAMDIESGRLDPLALPAAHVSQVDVRAVFDPAAGNDSQLQDTSLSFVVRLSDAAADVPEGGPGQQPTPSVDHHGSHHGGLADTGLPDLRLQVVAGAALVGAGLALVRRRKRVRHG